MFGFVPFTEEEAMQCYLVGSLKFFSIGKMKKTDYEFALSHPNTCWALYFGRWYKHIDVHDNFSLTLRP